VSDASPTMARLHRGLRMVTVPFPHLAGLVGAARVTLDARVPTMGVFASGRLVVNPDFAARLNDRELVFVLAHEMLHLALRTHDRARGAGRLEFNYAHDYIINDMLRAELGFERIPANGLDLAGAPRAVGRGDPARDAPQGPGDGLAHAGLGRRRGHGAGGAFGDRVAVVPRPDATADRTRTAATCSPRTSNARGSRTTRTRRPATRRACASSPRRRQRWARRWMRCGGGAASAGVERAATWPRCAASTARPGSSRCSAGSRPSRRPSARTRACRGARTDATTSLLPGRRRAGWLLNVALDTSASMADEIPRALGAIADFCDAAGVDQVRLVQCDAAVTGDEFLPPEALALHRIHGYGGSDLSPAFDRLAAEPQTRAVLVITDGDVLYPEQSPPYDVLWLLPSGTAFPFTPRYGRAVRMD